MTAAIKEEREPAFDPDTIESLRELQEPDEPDLVAELMEIFLSDAPQRIAELQAGLDGGDAKAVETAAHTLKSASANIGAQALSACCAQVEAKGRGGELEAAAPLFTALRAEFERAEAEAQNHIGG